MAADFRTRHGLRPLGCGIGLRRGFYGATGETERPLDWLEIIPENFMRFGGYPRRILDACAERWTVLPHGVGLNVGGPDPLNEEYLTGLTALCERLDPPWFSDHLCFTGIGGVDFQDLLPLPFSDEAVEHVVPRVQEIAKRVGRPFLLENPSYYAKLPGGALDEATFLTRVVEEADCGLLLDVNNVYVNSQNHGYDPYDFLDRIPAGRVVQMHLAGHTRQDDVIIDTHIGPIIDEVWKLYAHAVKRFGNVSTLIEWDQDIPSLDAYLDEADRARALLSATLKEAA